MCCVCVTCQFLWPVEQLTLCLSFPLDFEQERMEERYNAVISDLESRIDKEVQGLFGGVDACGSVSRVIHLFDCCVVDENVCACLCLLSATRVIPLPYFNDCICVSVCLCLCL